MKMKQSALGAVLLLAASLVLPGGGAARAHHTARVPQNQQLAKIRQGIASWYGPGFHGRRTANGERFDSRGMTAAHRYLPFGTRVRVTNLNNGRSAVVRINDRGPFAGNRIIDLSAGAARAVGMVRSGIAPVRLEILN